MSHAPEPDHYLYAIEFSDGVVKVGRTGRIGDRIAAHRRDGKKIGAVIRDCWISRPIRAQQIRRAEMFLIAECKQKWPIAQGLEWFDAPFAEVVVLAEELDEALQPEPDRTAA